jgi:hypothetical protein
MSRRRSRSISITIRQRNEWCRGKLPVAVRHFAGRTAELETLTGPLDDVAEAGDTVVISAIDGTDGIGKTALAVHWGHQVAGKFPDAQLYM